MNKGIGKTYLCPKCGMLYKTRFMDYNECLFCLKEVHEEISKKVGTKEKLRYRSKIKNNGKAKK